MPNYGFKMSLLVIAMSSFACKPPASRMTASNTVTIADPPIDKQLLSKPAGAWTFRSEAQDYSLDLPSSHWIQTKLVERTEFENRNKLDEHTHVVASSVTKRTEEEYRDFLLKFRANTKGKTYISAPIFEEGMTDVGNPFFYMALIEPGNAETEYVFVGFASVWLAKKGLSISVIYECQGRGKDSRPSDVAAHEKAARAICLSPR